MDFRDRTHMIISIDTEKAFEKNQNPFMIKALRRIMLGRTYITIIKALFAKPIVNIMLNREKI